MEKTSGNFTKRKPSSTRVYLIHSIVVLAFLSAEQAVAQDFHLMNDACGRLLQLIEGPFGALITASAGIGAIVASAMGGFRSAWALIVVAVSAFILRSYITLFFAPCFSAA